MWRRRPRGVGKSRRAVTDQESKQYGILDRVDRLP